MNSHHDEEKPSALAELQTWYASQCNGEWEHHGGIDIHSLDNPGWTFEVELAGTGLADTPFAERTENYEDAANWIVCRKQGTKFSGSGGPTQLDSLIRIFLEWAGTAIECQTGSIRSMLQS